MDPKIDSKFGLADLPRKRTEKKKLGMVVNL